MKRNKNQLYRTITSHSYYGLPPFDHIQNVVVFFQTKELLRKVYQFFVGEKEKNKPWALQNPIKRLVKATGIKPTTLRRYVHTDASDDAVQDVVKAVHKAAVQKTVKKNQKLDDFDKGVVRRTIYDLHKKSQSVTMPSLQQALKKKDIDVSISTVSRTVRLLGFRFYKNASSRRFVSEREDIVLMRMTYLRKIQSVGTCTCNYFTGSFRTDTALYMGTVYISLQLRRTFLTYLCLIFGY
ncbi:uncharacterized protein LOC127704242 [Mytilus californianus]|uniref:uncharacterized protein LOC127704242 n=1 Tax=Mytilus californianus TaxID=6549 RepID=UPI00224857E2|nr:uncharacterized protein LOC127704242 [Mytilus californianus]